MRFTDLFYWKIKRIINSDRAAKILRYPKQHSVRSSVDWFFVMTSVFHLSGTFSSIANATGKFSWMFEVIGSGPDECKKKESDHEGAALIFQF